MKSFLVYRPSLTAFPATVRRLAKQMTKGIFANIKNLIWLSLIRTNLILLQKLTGTISNLIRK